MDHTKKNIILYTIGAVVLFFVFNIASYATYDALRSGSNLFSGSDSDSDFSSDDEGYDGSCNVRGLAIHGDMYTYIPQTALDDPMYAAEYGYADAVSSEYIVDEIYSAESDPRHQSHHAGRGFIWRISGSRRRDCYGNTSSDQASDRIHTRSRGVLWILGSYHS